jgi:hypothetical protein
MVASEESVLPVLSAQLSLIVSPAFVPVVLADYFLDKVGRNGLARLFVLAGTGFHRVTDKCLDGGYTVAGLCAHFDACHDKSSLCLNFV